VTRNLSCFKAYDVRGKYPTELNEKIAYRIGRAYAEFVNPKVVVVGRDIRLTSELLSQALIEGLIDCGVEVLDIGLCGSEQVYFAAFYKQLDGGIMVTASHNPVDYNGFKFVRESSQPISSDTGLLEIKKRAELNKFDPISIRGSVRSLDLSVQYISHLLGYLQPSKSLKSLKIVTNAGNGVAGHVIDLLEKHLPFEFIKIWHEPDGNFPNGVPNPHNHTGSESTSNAILSNNADLGIAWDGDFDRCCFFDHTGSYIDSYYIIGLLSSHLLKQHPGEKIVYEPRLTWNTIDQTNKGGGTAVLCKTGHTFIKEKMRKINAIYGGEISAHHFFRSFGYCDSGMIPWLIICKMMIDQNKTLIQLVENQMTAFPSSGEISLSADHAVSIMLQVKQHYQGKKHKLDETEGISLEFEDWRFNLRTSQTETFLRLNVETRKNQTLLLQKTNEVVKLVKSLQ